MTTVGYGDIVPQTIAGKVFASIAAVFGILVIGMPFALISTKFYEYFKQLEMQSFIKHQTKKLQQSDWIFFYHLI